MSCLLHPCHWFPGVPPPPKVSAAAAAAAAACILRSIFEIDLFMFWNLGENGEKLKDLSLD
ncbi:hypothetical protein E1A91_A13G208000v1 [Gossypium mustelinum]|uniref:Uncharacterized protein n=2 Tax=Gossypium TaxID=3633 RepID=A0A5D2WME6_GOSMU|nr:hypothetical protein ES288_A13G211300v1 [Gossypium darwinii]TYJ02151.1 hypothetical protein E1A91_A13G208000v1 [Gossypium mustelinum]